VESHAGSVHQPLNRSTKHPQPLRFTSQQIKPLVSRFVSKTAFPLLKVFRLIKDKIFHDYRIEELIGRHIRNKPSPLLDYEDQMVLDF